MRRFLVLLGVLGASVANAQSVQLGSRTFNYTEIQQLTLAPDGVHVLTYAGKQVRLPAADNWKTIRDEVAPHLDRRLVIAYFEPPAAPLYRFPAWHSHIRGGCQGELIFGRDTAAFDSSKPGDSRTWTYREIESISSSGPNQLTVNTYERHGRFYTERRAFDFQLQEPITEAAFNVLWRKINPVSPALDVLAPHARLEHMADETVARILASSAPNPVSPSPIPQPPSPTVEQFLPAVAHVESRGNPHALSPKGALGIYQLMPETARRYGLQVGAGQDERSDPLKSRGAAARYLDDLFARFGDWKLALAAYNAGEGRVQSVIERTGIRDFSRMSWLKLLPEETRRYVPAVMAHQSPSVPRSTGLRLFALLEPSKD